MRRGKRLVEYDGPRIAQEEAQALIDQGNASILTLHDEAAINGWAPWNMARFINDSCAPHCESRLVRDRVWLYAPRSIRAGEDLTDNDGYEWDDAAARPCRCGAADCVGVMVAERYFDALRRREGA